MFLVDDGLYVWFGFDNYVFLYFGCICCLYYYCGCLLFGFVMIEMVFFYLCWCCGDEVFFVVYELVW